MILLLLPLIMIALLTRGLVVYLGMTNMTCHAVYLNNTHTMDLTSTIALPSNN